MSRKINDYDVILPRIDGSSKPNDWKGKDLFDIQYWVACLLGKRRSGKTSLINTLIRAFVTKNTRVIFIVPTFWKDSSYEAIRNFLDKKGIIYQDFQAIEDDGVNNLKIMMDVFEEKEKKEDSDDEDNENEKDRVKYRMASLDLCEPSKDKKNKKKKVEPEYIIVLDDISDEIRNPAVLKLCKNSRHYRVKTILSSQSITDIHPHIYNQLDYLVLFKNYNLDGLKHVYDKVQPDMSYEEFVNLYTTTTKKTDRRGLNSFILYDRNNGVMRENLNTKIYEQKD